MPRDLESYRDGIDVGREQMRAENERTIVRWLKSEAENARLTAEAREAHGIIDVLSSQIKQLHDDDARLRSLLRAVVREADRETNAFIAARAELGAEIVGGDVVLNRPLGRPLTPIDD